jgi:molecular chaperone Hsp33
MTFLQQDRIVRATGDAAKFRLVLVDNTRAANFITARHEAGGYAAQLLGQAAASALLLASGLKGPGTAQLRFSLSGDISRVAADATPFGLVRAMIPREEILATGRFEPMVLPQTLKVIKLDKEGRRISEGIVEMVTADLSESVTHYLLQSEQGKAVLRVAAAYDEPAGALRFAGGVLLEAFPEAKDSDWAALQALVHGIDFAANADKRAGAVGLDLDALFALFGDYSPQIHKEFEIEPFCPCSEEGVLRALSSLGREGLESLFLEGREAELFCEFCRKRYGVSQEKLLEMLNEAEAKDAAETADPDEPEASEDPEENDER